MDRSGSKGEATHPFRPQRAGGNHKRPCGMGTHPWRLSAIPVQLSMQIARLERLPSHHHQQLAAVEGARTSVLFFRPDVKG